MMKSITKKALFYIVTLLVTGMAAQSVRAESSLYWTEVKGKKISRSTLQGTLKENVRISTYHTPSHLALDQASAKMYWTGTAQPPNRGAVSFGTIRSADLDGSNEVLLLGDMTGSVIKHPVDIELDIAGGKMYWTEAGWPKMGVYRANLDGSFPEKLIDLISLRSNYGTGQGQSLEFGQVWGLALDLQNGRMCWTDYFAADIHCSDLNGVGITRVVTSAPGARGITIDPVEGKIYWVTGNAGDVMRVNADGSNLEQIVNRTFGTKLNYPMDIATDSTHLYFTDNSDGTVYRSNMDGSGVIVLHMLQYERKPGKFKNFEPMGIALSLAPPVVSVPSSPTVLSSTPAVPEAAIPASPALLSSVPTPVVSTPTVSLSLPKKPDVTYKSKRGRWDIFVPASTTGLPTTYSVIVFDPENPANRITLLSGQSTNAAAFVKIKGMSLASQGLPENASYVAITVNSAGKESPAGAVRVR